jgi:phosphatidylinositol glycan class Z
VVPALDHIFQENIHGTQIWWRTYSPPTWMLADTNNSTQFVTINDENPTFQLSENLNIVMDTMGIEKDLLHNVIQQLGTKNLPVYLITPTASFNTELNNTIMFEDQSFEEVWHYRYHIDMDHLDFGNIESLKPGISIYKLI